MPYRLTSVVRSWFPWGAAWVHVVALMVGVTLVGVPATPASLRAQDVTMRTDRAPRFLLASDNASKPPMRVEISRMPILDHRIAVALHDVTIDEALKTIARQSGLDLAYSALTIPLHRIVRLDAGDITVAAALTVVLLDLDVDVVLSRNGRAMVVKRGGVPQVGTIAGRVTERGTNAPISSAQVMVVGTGLTRYTDEKGQFRIPNVPPGDHAVTVRRLGFEVMSRKVRVEDGEAVTADFVMGRVATSLTEVVTTATGERSRLEVGNSVGTIRADSLVPTTLIRNMSDLLTARTPGVMVSNVSGLVGAPSFVRIRGMASVSLSNDPIIILDGIRLAPASNAGLATSVGSLVLGPPAGFPSSVNAVTARLDDIDPNTIESIDVLRGPSASSLYGTDAAAGVIVIKTKKGAAGAYHFNLLADNGTSHVIGTFPLQWVGYGHAPDGTPTVSCQVYAFLTTNIVDHTCMQDSIRGYDSYSDPRLSTLGTGTARNLSVNLSGGTEQLREFLSLRISDAVGMAKLSNAEADRIARMWGEETPSWIRHPNTEQNVTGMSRTNLQVARGLDLSLTANAIYRNTLLAGPGGLFSVFSSQPSSLARGYYDTLIYLPAEGQRARVGTLVKRGYASAASSYTPLSWLTLHATLGADYSLRTLDALGRASDCTIVLNPTGCPSGHSNNRGETYVTTVDLGAQATWAPQPWLSLRTSTGEQLSRTRYYELQAQNNPGTALAFGSDLLTPSPVTTTSGLQLYFLQENQDESATAGWYLEETASLRERFFLTASFRQDAASAFGADVNEKPPIYPRYSLSWVLSDESFFPKTSLISSVRLRSAYGHSGQEARQTAVLNNFATTTVFADGALAPGIVMSGVGNGGLRPERTAELEGGIDLSLFPDERVHLEGTIYRKISNDAITRQSLPISIGSPSATTTFGVLGENVNLGKVENRGWELSITAKLLDGRMVAWDLTVNASRNVNRLVSTSIADVISNSLLGGSNGNFVGYPLGAFFGHVITGYNDYNGDGILEFGEVRIGTPLVFLGSVQPEGELTYSNTLRFWGGAVQVNATLNQVNGQSTFSTGRTGDNNTTSQQVFLPAALGAQAALLQGSLGGSGFASKTNTLRFSELSVTGNLPASIASRIVHTRTASITFAVRNVALWTGSAMKDPNVGTGQVTDLNPSQSGLGTIPEPRDMTLRINLGY